MISVDFINRSIKLPQYLTKKDKQIYDSANKFTTKSCKVLFFLSVSFWYEICL